MFSQRSFGIRNDFMKYFGTFQKICVLLFLVGLPSWSWAGAAITYHGRILDTQKRPVQNSSVLFRIRVYSPNPEKCLLYEEVRTINMTDSDGVFVIPIGDGQGVRTTSDPGLQIEKVFANNPSVTLDTVNTPKLVCNSGSSFTASLLSQRHLAVSFDDNSGVGEQALPLMDINFVPLAVSAYDAQNLAGTPANSVLRLTSGNATPLSPANFSELLNLLNGVSSQYEKSGKLAGQNLPALSNGQVLGWSGGTWAAVTPMTSFTETDPSVKSFAKSDLPSCNAGEFLTPNGSGGFACAAVSGASGGTVTSVTAGTGLKNITSPGDPITSTGTLAVDVGTGANQIVQMGADTKLPVVDGSKLTNVVASGLSGTANINTSGSITSPQMSTQNLYIENALSSRVTITAPVSFTDYSWILPSVQGTSGQVLGMSATSGQLEWKTLSPSGVSSVTADAPVVIDSSAPSAPKVTLPKATAAVDGYLDKADFATFSSKQAAGSYLTTLQGDVASSNFSNGTVDVIVNKIKNVPVSAAPTLNGQVLRYESGNLVPNFISMLDLRSNVTGALALSSTCGTNQTLTFNSATDSLKCESISITKSQVSDLGTIGTLAAKSVIDLSTADVTNILPITNGGTGANSVAQGLVFAGPVSGTGAPSFRSLASTDLPASASYWQAATGGINFPSGNVGIGTTVPVATLQVASVSGFNPWGTPYKNTALGYVNTPAWYGSSLVMSNVTSGSKLGVIGYNDDTLYFGQLTSSSTALNTMTITANGNVGIGTTAPQASLHLNPNIAGAGPATSGTTPSTGIVARLSNAAGATLDHGMLPGGTQWLQATNVGDQSYTYPIVLNPNGGLVGIGLLNPTYQLQLSTDSAAKPGTSTWTIASDERLKDIRAPFTRGLNELLGLNTIYFNYKHDNPLGLPSQKEFVGIKAQDAQKVIPEAVSTDEQGYLHVTNDSIIWTAVNAIKELYGKFVEQDREIAALKAENEKLKAYLCGRDPEATFCR
jgi:hypothetical protein